MLSRERVTCFTQLCSDPKTELKPEFLFKGKGTRTHPTPPKGVHYQWSPEGSYRTEQIFGIIDKLQIDLIRSQNNPLQYMYWMIILFM